MIQHLKNNEINLVKWDNCINKAINGSVFAYSWYLNILCEDWEALILDDYEYVMPLLQKSKYNKKILFTSKLGLRLGVFSNQLLSEKIVHQFIKTIPWGNSIIDISFNVHNKFTVRNIEECKTYELDLILPYKRIAEKYTPEFQETIIFAKKNKINIVKGLLPNDIINFSSNKNVLSRPKLDKIDNQKLRMIIAYSLRYGLGETYCAYTANNNLCAIAFFIKSKRKLHLLYATSNLSGLKLNAFNLLIDKYIEDHSEKNLTLNLENVISNNKLNFFTGVGAYTCNYHRYYSNKLMWPFKLFYKTN